jgi:predicted nucleic acid-binding protein
LILVDTSVWINHLRYGDSRLAMKLEETSVLSHPFVIGEVALGQLRKREEILTLLGNLPPAKIASHDEVLAMIDQRSLSGAGIGWVDVHLLAAAVLSDASLWTLDRQLAKIAKGLDVGLPH